MREGEGAVTSHFSLFTTHRIISPSTFNLPQRRRGVTVIGAGGMLVVMAGLKMPLAIPETLAP